MSCGVEARVLTAFSGVRPVRTSSQRATTKKLQQERLSRLPLTALHCHVPTKAVQTHGRRIDQCRSRFPGKRWRTLTCRSLTPISFAFTCGMEVTEVTRTVVTMSSERKQHWQQQTGVTARYGKMRSLQSNVVRLLQPGGGIKPPWLRSPFACVSSLYSLDRQVTPELLHISCK